VVQLGSRATDQVRRAEYNKHGRSATDCSKLAEVQQTNKQMFRAVLLYGELR
jgi:transposase